MVIPEERQSGTPFDDSKLNGVSSVEHNTSCGTKGDKSTSNSLKNEVEHSNRPDSHDDNPSKLEGATLDAEKGLVQPGPTAAREREKVESTSSEPNIVWWDGDQDPHNPMNWTEKRKWTNIAILSVITFMTPLGSSFFAPGVPEVMEDFNTTDQQLATFVVSVYVLGFAFGPLVIAPLSEMYGRLPLYQATNALFVVFSIACAVSSSMDMLVVFRFFMGLVGSAPLTIGAGTINDLMPVERRGGATAIWAMGPLMGPVVAPIAGGYLTEAKGWRWVFWVIVIVSGGINCLSIFVMRETYAPIILERKAIKLRKETGNHALRSKLDSGITRKELWKRSIFRPTKMLFRSPIVALTSLYMAVVYGVLYLLFTTFTFVFEGQYGFSSGQVGLTFIGIGVGMFIGLALVGKGTDLIVRTAKARGERVFPELRLPLYITIPGTLSVAGGLYMYGWTCEYKVHWIAPIIGTALVGFGMLCAFLTIQAYLIDAFTIHAASAMAANAVLRSLFGAVFPLFALQMYDAMGLGWGNSLLGFIMLALLPVPVIFKFYGERIRTSPRFHVNW
ncbi:MFS general substrate transporter [Patellaria atrata CBS 101060]|uniref:MFS general substrate transporter n=1 Tax=Patellaria atrata CBS 101060 TaxID=1346257 RepID=A0A9P4SJF5_9PEZI|nr:MFS general substrate transporter [Patellaria atrata CBS 101060]